MAKTLGDGVNMFATCNEPWCFAYLGHASGVHAPGLTDPAAAVSVAHHQLLGHGLALQAMRAERDDLELGIAINPTNVRGDGTPPVGDDSVRRVDGLHNRWWLDALLAGTYPADVVEDLGALAAVIEPGDAAEIAQPLDWLGINYYADTLHRHGLGRHA